MSQLSAKTCFTFFFLVLLNISNQASISLIFIWLRRCKFKTNCMGILKNLNNKFICILDAFLSLLKSWCRMVGTKQMLWFTFNQEWFFFQLFPFWGSTQETHMREQHFSQIKYPRRPQRQKKPPKETSYFLLMDVHYSCSSNRLQQDYNYCKQDHLLQTLLEKCSFL